MNFTSTMLIAFAMSTDAFAASVGKGSALYKPSLGEALRTGVIFGMIEAITPIIGWMAGIAAAAYISKWDHWIAFTLLSILGLRLIYSGFKNSTVTEEKPNKNTFWMLSLTGFATSIDALIVGVSLAFVDANILWIALAIGLTTTCMVTIGVLLGRLLGITLGKGAEIIGGLILIGMGTMILYTHLTTAAYASYPLN
jgi:putative Mn2+ efflux pump MntP